MDAFFEFLQQNPVLPLVFLILTVLILVFLIIQTFAGRKSQARLFASMLESHEKLQKSACEDLAEMLSNYAENELLARVQESYEHLISKDLVPAVSGAGQALADLSAQLIARQEGTMKEVAVELADAFALRTKEYLQQEAEIFGSMNAATADFSTNIAAGGEVARQLSAQFEDIYEKAGKLAQSLVETANKLGEQLSNLDSTFEKNAAVSNQLQDDLQKSSKMLVIAAKTVEGMEQAVDKAVENVSSQQEFAANVMQKAVEDMSENTQNAARQLMDDFASSIKSNADVMNETVAALEEVAEKIHSTAGGFSEGLDAAYEKFDGSIDEKISHVSNKFSASAEKLSNEMQGSASAFAAAVSLAYENFDNSTSTKISDITEKFSASADNLASKMQGSSEGVALGVSRAYETFSRSVDDKMTGLDEDFSKAAAREFDKINDAARAYSESFTKDISGLNESFTRHIDNLHVVTNQLNNTVASFKADSDTSAQRFETGIDKLVKAALREMDSSLADIVGRLATVAESIGEAADALPRAVRSIKDTK